MAWFRCLIEGENFPGSLIGKAKPVGFFTTRWVQAETAEEAERLALELLRQEPSLQLKSSPPPAEAKIYFAEIVEVDGLGGENSGAVWFDMDS